MQTLPEEGRTRVIPTTTNPPPKPGHADTLRPGRGRLIDQIHRRLEESIREGADVHAADLEDNDVGSQGEMLREKPSAPDVNAGSSRILPLQWDNEAIDPDHDNALEF